MAKTKRQIAEDLKLIDVVIEILDARIPVSSQNPDMKQLIKQVTAVLINMTDEKLKEVCEYYKLNYINNYSYGHEEILAKHIAKIVSSISKKDSDSIVKLIYAMGYNKESIIAKKDNQNRLYIALM